MKINLSLILLSLLICIGCENLLTKNSETSDDYLICVITWTPPSSEKPDLSTFSEEKS